MRWPNGGAFVFATASFLSVTHTRGRAFIEPDVIEHGRSAPLRRYLCRWIMFNTRKHTIIFHRPSGFPCSLRTPSDHISVQLSTPEHRTHPHEHPHTLAGARRPYSVNIVAQKSRYQPSSTCEFAEFRRNTNTDWITHSLALSSRPPAGGWLAFRARDAQAQ